MIAEEEYGGDSLIFHESCDIGFHDCSVATLVKAGMSKSRAEEGMEYYSDLWFEKYINTAFNNRYDPIYMMNNPYYKPVDPIHRKTWLRLRRYAYYQYHKDIMDKYGNITDDMKMSVEEVRPLYNYLEDENKKRKKFLESFHDNLMDRLGYGDLNLSKNKTKSLEEKNIKN